jgi:hypothetical protein
VTARRRRLPIRASPARAARVRSRGRPPPGTGRGGSKPGRRFRGRAVWKSASFLRPTGHWASPNPAGVPAGTDRLRRPLVRRTVEQLPEAEGAALRGPAQQRRVVIASQSSGLDVRSSLHGEHILSGE